MTTDASVNKLIINTLTREQYDNIPDKSVTELYMVTDDTTYVEASDLKTINNQSLLGSGNMTIDSLPNQSGQDGKYLTTNGTTASWETNYAMVITDYTAS